MMSNVLSFICYNLSFICPFSIYLINDAVLLVTRLQHDTRLNFILFSHSPFSSTDSSTTQSTCHVHSLGLKPHPLSEREGMALLPAVFVYSHPLAGTSFAFAVLCLALCFDGSLHPVFLFLFFLFLFLFLFYYFSFYSSFCLCLFFSPPINLFLS
jgi:hypothetical protein